MSYPTALPLSRVRFDHGFLTGRAQLVRDTVIPGQWAALNDRISGAERSGCVDNLQVAAGEKEGKFHGLFWQDSDLAKWIEAASQLPAGHAPRRGARCRTRPAHRHHRQGAARRRLCAVSYVLWANRGEGEMRVWLRET